MSGLTTCREFPFCVPTVGSTDVGDGTNYPIGVDKETIFKWFYRVKKWQLTCEYTFDVIATNGGTAQVSGNGPTTHPELDINPVTVESDMSCKSQIFLWGDPPAIIADAFDIQTVGNATFLYELSLFFLGAGTPSVVFYDDLFYPYFSAYVSITGDALVNFGPRQIRSISASPSDWPTPLSIPYEIDGTTFSMTGSTRLFNGGGGGPGSATATVTDIEIKINPIEFWEYDNGVDGPIWDSTTGAELQDPFSVQ